MVPGGKLVLNSEIEEDDVTCKIKFIAARISATAWRAYAREDSVVDLQAAATFLQAHLTHADRVMCLLEGIAIKSMPQAQPTKDLATVLVAFPGRRLHQLSVSVLEQCSAAVSYGSSTHAISVYEDDKRLLDAWDAEELAAIKYYAVPNITSVIPYRKLQVAVRQYLCQTSLWAVAVRCGARMWPGCALCGSSSGTLRKCAQCNVRKYCSRACLRAEWCAHKEHCGACVGQEGVDYERRSFGGNVRVFALRAFRVGEVVMAGGCPESIFFAAALGVGRAGDSISGQVAVDPNCVWQQQGRALMLRSVCAISSGMPIVASE